ncbi:MAG: hypothetical protein WBM84_09575 [Sedimenticolaceae bacterium]
MIPAPVEAIYADDNPFVEAMLRMMEIFGLIDRSRLPHGVPYLPGYGQSWAPGMDGISGYTGIGPPMGLSSIYGAGGWPGPGQMPGPAGWPPAGFAGAPGAWGHPGRFAPRSGSVPSGYLDGAWELDKGGFVIIKGNIARLFVSPERSQDFTIGYDRYRLWWRPRGTHSTSHYRYQVRDGRMIMQDSEGRMLLLRRRR